MSSGLSTQTVSVNVSHIVDSIDFLGDVAVAIIGASILVALTIMVYNFVSVFLGGRKFRETGGQQYDRLWEGVGPSSYQRWPSYRKASSATRGYLREKQTRYVEWRSTDKNGNINHDIYNRIKKFDF